MDSNPLPAGEPPAESLHWSLFIAGVWMKSQSGEVATVVNPATEEPVATVSLAGTADLEAALKAAARGFELWRQFPPFERGKILRKAADLLRARVDLIAPVLTREQGKPLAEAKSEILSAAEVIDWFAEEGLRTYGMSIPARAPNIWQLIIKEPVGPVAAFSPWNFPINQAVRKIAAALAAGCSIVLKGPEEAPGPCVELVQVFAEAGLPGGVLNLVFGIPAQIAEYLIAHPIIRKVSFTGSTAVGKRLAALAGLHMKRVTMELGGHAPALVFDDANLEHSAKLLAAMKYRNAGQVCISPTRLLIQRKSYEEFLQRFISATDRVIVGNGAKPETTMGPMAHRRRLEAMDKLVTDAVDTGATLERGGRRIGHQGFFFPPTVLTGVGPGARLMNEEPFGPIATIAPFGTVEDGLREANRLSYGLAAYAWTSSPATANRLGAGMESGMISINHYGLGFPELPFGGIKDSGYGTEGGPAAIEAYLNSKFISRSNV